MADYFTNQTRDPQTGRFLKRELRESLKAQHTAGTAGASGAVKSITAIEMLAQREGKNVRQYVMGAVRMVKESADSVERLRQILPLLRETKTVVDQDATLDDKVERPHIQKTLDQLIGIVTRQLSVRGRLSAGLKNVMRRRGGGMADTLASSGSPLWGAVGRAMERRAERREAAAEAGQSVAEGRAKLLETLRQRVAPDAATGKDYDDDDYGFGMGGPKRKGGSLVERELGGSGGGEGSGSKVLSRILAVDKNIHKEVKDINANLVATREQDAEQFEAVDKAQERAADEKKDNWWTKLAGMFGSKKDDKGKKSGGLLEMIMGWLKIGAGAILKFISATIVPMITAALSSIGAALTAAASPILVALAGIAAALAVAKIALEAWRLNKTLDQNEKDIYETGSKAKQAEIDFLKRVDPENENTERRKRGERPLTNKQRMDKIIEENRTGVRVNGIRVAPPTPPAETTAPLPSVSLGPMMTEMATAGAGSTSPTRVPPPPLTTPAPSSKPQRTSAAKVLLDQIAKGEGADYDTTLANGRLRPGGREQETKDPITNYRMRDIYQLQTAMLRHPENKWKSSAVGRYQIVRQTLFGKGGTAEKPAPGSLAQIAGLGPNDRFTPEVQDALGTILLKRRGYDKVQRGEMSAEQFQENLSKEWASVASASTGQSFYGQHTGTKTGALMAALAPSLPSPTRSGAAVTDATIAAGGGRATGSPTIVTTNNIMTGGGGASQVIPMPITVDSGPYLRRVTGSGGVST